MSMTLFLGSISIHCLRPSLPLKPLASSKALTQASSPNPHLVVQYLVQSCGLSSDKALKASKYIQHLKSDKADEVLRFLREIGVSEADIKTAVSRDARILCTRIEKIWRPNIGKLQELGLSMEDISAIIASNPNIFLIHLTPKIDFFMKGLGSVESCQIFKLHPHIFANSLEKVLMPNLSFLQEQCGLSPSQIALLIYKAHKLICYKPDVLKMEVERAGKLGVARSSPNFINVLLYVSYQKQCIIDAKLDNLTSLGFSQEEVALMISKDPLLLRVPEKLVGSKMEYLIKEAGCDKIDVVNYPALLLYSLEKRLIPRNIVRKLLMSKGFPVAKINFPNFIQESEEKFLKKFVQPYEHHIPGLYQAYVDASTGKIGAVQ